jgi:hypothetical protein
MRDTERVTAQACWTFSWKVSSVDYKALLLKAFGSQVEEVVE